MIKPLKNKVILKEERKEKTSAGIVITSEYEKDNIIAQVISLPDNIEDEYSNLKAGVFVIVSKFSGSKIEYENQQYIVTNISDILAVIEEG